MKVDVCPEVQKEAHRLVSAAIQSSLLSRLPCVICGSRLHVDAHHPDYGRPLDVQWLCRSHHLMMHRNAEFAAGRCGYGVKEFDMSRLGRRDRKRTSRVYRRIDGSRCGLVSNVEIAESQVDPLQVEIQRKADKKAKRARNRNNKARRGHKKAMKARKELMGVG